MLGHSSTGKLYGVWLENVFKAEGRHSHVGDVPSDDDDSIKDHAVVMVSWRRRSSNSSSTGGPSESNDGRGLDRPKGVQRGPHFEFDTAIHRDDTII